MIREKSGPWRTTLALALFLTLGASALGARAPQPAAAASNDSCTGGSLQPNGLSEQVQLDGSAYTIYLNGFVTPLVAPGSLRVDVQLVTYLGSTAIGTAGTDGYGHYYWAGSLSQSTFGLNGPGAWTTFYLKFLIPYQRDEATCSLVAYYTAPPSPPTPAPLPTPGPLLTPQPSLGTIPTIFTITAGQQTTITQAGTAGTDVEFQTSTDLTTWSWLGPRLTIPVSGPASYTFAPTQTAYYRTYFYATGQTNNPVRGIVSAAPAPTPTPSPPPTSVPTIYTIIWGQSTSVTSQGAPGTAVRLESSLDDVMWTWLGSAVTDSVGVAAFTFRPKTNLYLRATVAGQLSPAVRGVVRQVAILRPTGSGKATVVRRGATVVFAMTIRPQTSAPAAGRFRIYQWGGSSWNLLTERRVNVDAIGVARLVWRFTKPGRWYARAMADATAYNAASSWSQVERYDVR